jgi:UDP-2-acetamido-2-deoxy-ribo-hexuluronate aminotransferase
MEFRDLKAQYKKYFWEINNRIYKVLKTSHFIGGEEVIELEKKLATYVGTKHCITCANGTDAMTLVLDAWGITEGDAIFVPNFTFFATAEVVAARKATPIFIDVKKETFNIDPLSLEFQINKVISEGKLKPKVILTVDLFGLPAEYEEITKIAKKYGLKILEDSAQGFGGSIKDKKACSFGDAATTSFFPAKPLGCYGDGGAIFTNNDLDAKIIQSLKVHGKGEDKYDNIRIGYNSRLDTIQAAILLVKFKAFEKHELKDVQKVYGFYDKYLNDSLLVKPKIPPGYISSFAQYTVILKDKKQRKELQDYLKENKIPTFIYYNKTIHQQRAFEKLNSNNVDLKNSIVLADTVLSLPMHPYLKEKEVFKISKLINSFLARLS